VKICDSYVSVVLRLTFGFAKAEALEQQTMEVQDFVESNKALEKSSLSSSRCEDFQALFFEGRAAKHPFFFR